MQETNVERTLSPGLVLGSIGLSVAVGVGALIWCYGLQNHVTEAEKQLTAQEAKNTALQERLEATSARLSATTETLSSTLGLTQRQIEMKTQTILAQQKAAEAAQEAQTQKLADAQAQASKQIGAVTNEVAATKTDLGATKTDVAATKADLENTKTQMNKMMGDEGVMSGLIATNKTELEELRHKGDRNYYEFTLTKGKQSVLVSTIKLQLKKVDEKKSKYTLAVSADDKSIEKKDKNLDEPVQFYSGKSPMLFEIVVNSIGKNQVSGYLSTPKNAPAGINP